MRIISFCRELPNPDNRSSGVFVLRRLSAMARQSSIDVVQLVNYFPGIKPLPEWSRSERLENGDLRIRPEPMFYLPKILKSLDGWWLSRAAMKAARSSQMRRPIDIIDAHFGYPEGAGSIAVGRKLGIPVFITLRGFEAEYINRPLIGRQLAEAMRAADGCICVSESLKNIALANGVAEERVSVIRNGIDRNIFYPASKEDARESLGWDKTDKIIVSVGHLVDRKRHHVLVRAFKKVRDVIPNAKLVIVGSTDVDPNYTSRLNRDIADCSLTDTVQILGNINADSVTSYLRAADVFALGTEREGCCNAVLEALACGLPVVTTPVGDNRYFIESGENGYIVPVDDDVSMASAVVDVLKKDEWDRHHISSSLKAGSWDDVAGKVLDVFARAIDRNQLHGQSQF